jgi:hypothetical protein
MNETRQIPYHDPFDPCYANTACRIPETTIGDVDRASEPFSSTARVLDVARDSPLVLSRVTDSLLGVEHRTRDGNPNGYGPEQMFNEFHNGLIKVVALGIAYHSSLIPRWTANI